MRKKTFFVILIVLGVLYLLSLGVGVFKGPEEDQAKSARSASGNPALGAIDWLLSPFAPSLLLGNARCNGQAVAGDFTLAAGAGCTITLANPNKDYRRGSLHVETANVDLLVFEPAGDRVPASPLSCARQARRGRLTLCIAYAPNDSPKASPNVRVDGNWARPPRRGDFTVSVQRGGGALHLACAGCRAPDRTLKLRLE